LAHLVDQRLKAGGGDHPSPPANTKK
jgi:hypothetical protein